MFSLLHMPTVFKETVGVSNCEMAIKAVNARRINLIIILYSGGQHMDTHLFRNVFFFFYQPTINQATKYGIYFE